MHKALAAIKNNNLSNRQSIKITIIKILALQLISRKTLLLPLDLPARDNFHMG